MSRRAVGLSTHRSARFGLARTGTGSGSTLTGGRWCPVSYWGALRCAVSDRGGRSATEGTATRNSASCDRLSSAVSALVRGRARLSRASATGSRKSGRGVGIGGRRTMRDGTIAGACASCEAAPPAVGGRSAKLPDPAVTPGGGRSRRRAGPSSTPRSTWTLSPPRLSAAAVTGSAASWFTHRGSPPPLITSVPDDPPGALPPMMIVWSA